MDATVTPSPGLQQVIDDLRARNEDFCGALAGLREGMLTPAALASDIVRLESWLRTQGIAADGMDDKTRAAYMIGGLAWSVCSWIAAFELSGQKPIRRVAFAQERYWWGGPEDGHEYVRYPISIDVGAGPANHRKTIERIFAPIIAATMVTSGLSAGAQWRLVADNVASAFLHVGKALNLAGRGMDIAGRIVGEEGRLNNGKTGFVEISAGGARDWFLVRGGCCRYYTTPGGVYCTSCVLRKRDDQIARYTAHLRALQTLE